MIFLNDLGLIPGPEESEETFIFRKNFCINLEKNIMDTLIPADGIKEEKTEENSLRKEAYLLSSTYGIYPDWAPLFFSNWKLFLWQGAGTWIFQLEENGPQGTCIQLRKSFYQKRKLLGLYAREELLAHEFSHVGRMAFEEKKYEELLAYRLSKRFIPRFLGPLLQNIGESRLFMIMLLTMTLTHLFILFQESSESFVWLYAGFIAYFLFIFSRLVKNYYHFIKTDVALEEMFGENGKKVLYRLTDQEIDEFGKFQKDELKSYISCQTSLRWQFIRAAYGEN